MKKGPHFLRPFSIYLKKMQNPVHPIMVDTLAQKVLDWVKENTHNTIDPEYTTHLQRDEQGNLKE